MSQKPFQKTRKNQKLGQKSNTQFPEVNKPESHSDPCTKSGGHGGVEVQFFKVRLHSAVAIESPAPPTPPCQLGKNSSKSRATPDPQFHHTTTKTAISTLLCSTIVKVKSVLPIRVGVCRFLKFRISGMSRICLENSSLRQTTVGDDFS